MSKTILCLLSSIAIMAGNAMGSEADIEAECNKAVEAGDETGDCACIAELAANDDDVMAGILEAVANNAPLDSETDAALAVCRD